jgi:hypothetical protein
MARQRTVYDEKRMRGPATLNGCIDATEADRRLPF